MGRVHAAIDDTLAAFLRAQHLFFVATAPSGNGGHINLSPKGLDSFRILDPHTVAYLDLTGSGVETIAHLRDNGRITLMFCAFDGPPKIVRLHGRGEAVRPDDPRFADLRRAFGPDHAEHGLRSIIVVDVERVSDSCGFAVPLMQYVGERGLLTEWAQRKSPEDLAAYRRTRNAASIDGLPALDEALGSAHDRAPAST